ncbi:MAG: hypothetical protein RI973_518 [Bacteroidota bacterium]|jgi:uncharacterized protein (TIGR02145 family)
MKNTKTQHQSPSVRRQAGWKAGAGAFLTLALIWLSGLVATVAAQTVVGGQIPDSSAMLEVRSTSRGFLLPRLTTEQRNAISKPQTGLMIFNNTLNCVEVNIGSTTAPDWICIATGSTPPPAPVCRAKVNATDFKNFLCHNLGAANTSADPFTPSWEIIGGYWQWGRKGPEPSQWLNTNTPNFAHGPTGPGAGETNQAAITGWSTEDASNIAWSDASKTANDPCPQGFRVPTKAQWDGVLNAAYNTQSVIGNTWSNSPTNFSSGRLLGTELMLPAAGKRDVDNGSLDERGNFGYYWSSTVYEIGSDYARYLYFNNSNVATDYDSRRFGNSIRCIAE